MYSSIVEYTKLYEECRLSEPTKFSYFPDVKSFSVSWNSTDHQERRKLSTWQ